MKIDYRKSRKNEKTKKRKNEKTKKRKNEKTKKRKNEKMGVLNEKRCKSIFILYQIAS